MEDIIVIRGPYGVKIWVRISSTEIAGNLEKIKTNLGDMRPVWKEVANIMRRSFAETFRQGGRPKWEPLKEGTIAGKAMNPRAVYGNARGRARIRRLEQMVNGKPQRSLSNILVIDGSYRDSFVTKNRDHVENISKNGLETGSQHYLAPFHEDGTGIHGPNRRPFYIRPVRAKSLRWFSANGAVFSKGVQNPGVPPRPVLIVQEEDYEKINSTVLDHMMKGINK